MSHDPSETDGCLGRIVGPIVIEDDVHHLRFAADLFHPRPHFLELIVRIVVVKSFGDGFPRKISTLISAVQAEITQRRLSQHVERRHDVKVIAFRSIHGDEGR